MDINLNIKVRKTDCRHMTMSVYNSNYYRLPFIINKCDVLHESYDLAEEFNGNSIGKLKKGPNGIIYEPHYWLHQNDNDEYFIIDTRAINPTNEWT